MVCEGAKERRTEEAIPIYLPSSVHLRHLELQVYDFGFRTQTRSKEIFLVKNSIHWKSSGCEKVNKWSEYE